MLSARQAVELCESLEAVDVRYYLIGGWGVDALLGRQTRSHKDLDILAMRDDLANLRGMLESQRFTVSKVWKESCWIEDLGEPWPTAFVADDSRGRAIDVHLIGVLPDGTLVQHYDNPWSFPESFDAAGVIAGKTIPCVSVDAQLKIHSGYVLPSEHLIDLDLLRRLVTYTAD